MRLLIMLILSSLSALAHSHALAPSMLQIQQSVSENPWVYPVLIRQDIASSAITVVWPADCQAGSAKLQREQRQIDKDFELRCQTPLNGRSIDIDGLNLRTSALMLRDETEGTPQTRLIDAAEPSIQIGQVPDNVWRRYLTLGSEHILFGWDHLMLVLGVFWLAGSLMRTIGLATAFTLGHSLTLAVVALNLWQFPATWVEFAIALTLLWLALQLGHSGRMISGRQDYALITVFGLIHGMGFASSLLAIGLPQINTLQALLAFNLGVELGQIGVLIGLAATCMLLAKMRSQFVSGLRLISTYAIGSLAVFWLIERAPLLLK